MSDETLQHLDPQQIEQYLQINPGNPQALILSAYLEEKKKWLQELNSAKVNDALYFKQLTELKIKIAVEENVSLAKAKQEVENQSGFIFKVLKLFRIKTKIEKELQNINDKIDSMKIELKSVEAEYLKLREEYLKIYSNPPQTDQYELAMIGNSLFKPR